MKRVKPLAMFVLAAFAATGSSADPMLKKQAELEQERALYLQQVDQKGSEAQQGWHWYKDPEPTEEAPPQPQEALTPLAPTAAPSEMVKIDVKWLRENLPRLLDDAMNNPGDMQKVKTYWLAQKMAVDMATKFQDATRRMYAVNPELSEDNRRPVTQFALETHNEEVKAGKKEAIKKVFKNAGIWFFYSSTCQYCIKEGPILNYLERLYGVNILAISMDGNALPGSEFANTVVDEGGVMSTKLGVDKTPSMFLVANDGSKIHKLSEGLITLEQMIENTLYIAQAAGFITEADLQGSREVRQYLMTDPVQQDGTNKQPSLIEVSKADLESNPQALISALEARLNFPSHNTQPVNTAPVEGND